ncbi:M23 family metallopeptidase [Microbacterium sp. NPDC077184]|uniref:murein hydrolase activator EnvC family protein n=1 Tax=Microbacterium sp. NPDC077184 TaxID=3154764 RepID=UPI0034130E48
MTAHALRTVLVTASVLLAPMQGMSPADPPDADTAVPAPAAGSWTWPVSPAALVRPFEPPAHAYAPGHRGIDIGSTPGAPVHAPAAGMVVFAGHVVDRPVISIDHGDGVVSSMEPIDPTVEAGDVVDAGSRIGSVTPEGHGAPGRLHLGIRVQGAYVDPLSLLSSPARAVLLPCC